jgi:DNA-binding transcriptional MerR regulator
LALIVRGRKVGLTIRAIRDILGAYDEEGQAAQYAVALRVFKERITELERQRALVDKSIEALTQASSRLAAEEGAVSVGGP